MDMQAGPRKQAPLSAEARRGHLAMLAFSALVAGSFSLGAMVAPLVDPAALTALRFALAAAVVGLVAALGPGLRAEQFRAPWRHVVLGFLMALYFVLMFEGLKTATAVSTAAVFTLTPLMAAGFGWVLLRQGLTGRMALALSIGALGAVWVIFRGDPAALAAFEVGRGEAVFFAGCVAHAFYAPLVRKLNRGEPALSLSFGMMVAGCAMLTLWAWAAIRATNWAGLPAIVWITLVYIAVAASAASFVLLQYAALRLPASKVMAYTYLTPAWVILWEIVLLRGAPPPVVLGGVVLTVLALWMLLKD
ncbi:MAG: DMT family transporter [Pseudorhodobacter sp.]